MSTGSLAVHATVWQLEVQTHLSRSKVGAIGYLLSQMHAAFVPANDGLPKRKQGVYTVHVFHIGNADIVREFLSARGFDILDQQEVDPFDPMAEVALSS